jgi:hypothetical protein
MLCSPPLSFVYFKTGKTAGTTIETLLQQAIYQFFEITLKLPLEKQDEIQTPEIFVAARAGGKRISTLSSHSPPSEFFASNQGRHQHWKYVCFAVRNPWDKLVSSYYWQRHRKGLKIPSEVELRRKDFEDFLINFKRMKVEEEIISLVDREATVIFYEDLEGSVKNLATFFNLNISHILSGLKTLRYKSTNRPYETKLDLAQMYTAKSNELVHEHYRDWIEVFHYRKPF